MPLRVNGARSQQASDMARGEAIMDGNVLRACTTDMVVYYDGAEGAARPGDVVHLLDFRHACPCLLG